MDTTIDQQTAMDEALVPHAQRLRIGRSNFRLLSDIKSKESTLQLVYDVLHICPFFKAFLVTSDLKNISSSNFVGLYNMRNVDYAYLMWEDFVYQVEHKNSKKSNEMYYPWFTKVIIHHFMSKDPSIPKRNKVNWNYVRDDHMFSTIKLVSRHQNTQQFGSLLPIELTNEEIRNSNAYKGYYAIATGAAPPKTKASVRRTRNEGTGSIPGVPDAPTDESEEELSWNSTDNEGADNEGKDGKDDEEDKGDDGEEGDGDDDDEDDDGEEGIDDDDDQEIKRNDDKDDEEKGGDDDQEYDEETRDEESFDPIPKTPENSDDKGNGDEDLRLNFSGEEGHIKEEEEDKLYRDVNINQGRGIQATPEVEESHVTLTLVNPNGQQQSSSVSSQFVTSMLNPIHDVGMESIFETTSQMDTQTPTSVTPLPMTATTMTPSTIATITTTSQAPILPTTISSTIIQNLPSFGSLFGFDNRLRTLEANFSDFMQTNQFAGAFSTILGIVQRYMDQWMNEAVKKIIKEQVKEQVKVQVSKILPRIEQAVNEQLEAEVLTRSSHSSKTSYDVAADLSQRNLYKALVEAYKFDKIILDTYRETVNLKRHRDDDADKDEEPSIGPDRGSKRRREGNEPESARAPIETTTRSAGRNHHLRIMIGIRLCRLSTKAFNQLKYHLEEVFKATTDQLDWVNPEGQHYPHNLLKPLPLIPNNRGRRVIPFEHFINNDLEYLCGGASRRKYTTFITKTKAADYGHIKWIEDLVPMTIDDDKLYKFKEGDFKRLCIQDIKDMLLLLVQGRLTNLTVKERFAFNVSLRMLTRSISIQRRVEDLQQGVESYQKKLNLTKADSHRYDLKRKEAYTAYSNLRGFIYQNKDKKNRLMRIDELHKFSDGTLTDVRTTLDDRLKGIRMQYLPQ
nr:hypothetical protein [Tanacetum cinerariifolium]